MDCIAVEALALARRGRDHLPRQGHGANSAIAEITRETLEKHEKSCKFPETASDLGPNVNHFHVLSYGFA